MLTGLLGKKLGMTQIFTETGEVIPVTVIEVGPGYVVQKKNVETDGYEAVQLGFCLKRTGNHVKQNLPIKGHLKKAGLDNLPISHFKEFRPDAGVQLEIGQKVTCEFFKEGEKVDVSGIIKGRGFSGGMKRHGWAGQPMTHGSMMHRRPGGTGASATPSRIIKGKTLPGQYGNTNITVQNLVIRKVDIDRNLLLIEGAIPGAASGIVKITKAVKSKKK
jgi:large subunit ribosomal protein L3